MTGANHNRMLAIGLIVSLVVGGLCLAGTGSVAAQPAEVNASDLEGSGTDTDPYLITTAAELQAMEDDLDAQYELANDIDASDTATWNEGNGFRPIEARFTGELDGRNHRITGLTIDRPSMSPVGLFEGLGDGGSVRNVEFVEADISGGNNVGAIAGYAEPSSEIQIVGIQGSVNGTGSVGGLVGLNRGTISQSGLNAQVTGTGSVGGVAGSNDGTIFAVGVNGSVDGYRNTGGVAGANRNQIDRTVVVAPVNGSIYIGGTVGYNHGDASVRKSTATGTVTATESVGGIAGFNEGMIQRTSVLGSVTGSERRTGGITGVNREGEIVRTFAAGSVSSDSDVGGVVGLHVSGLIQDTYWDREATGQTSSDGSATGLTTAEMTGSAATENMAGLDFTTYWTPVVAGEPIPPTPAQDGYPILNPLGVQTQLAEQGVLTPPDDGGTTGTLSVSLSDSSIPTTQTSVTVTVTDESGDPVEGATVSISDLGQSGTTDTSGMITLTVNPSVAGSYPVDVSADGYEDATATLTVTAAGEVPTEWDLDTEQYTAIYEGGEQPNTQEISTKLNTWFTSENGTIDGTEFNTQEISTALNYWFANQ